MEIRGYQAGDEHKIYELFSMAFKKDISPEFWKWRFLDNPFLAEPFIDLMWDGDTLAGHYAVSPIGMNVNGQQVMSALSMTTMTNPNYGGQGIFPKLAASIYQKLTDANVQYVWGFPNMNSHYSFIKKLAWKNIATIPMMTLSHKMEGATPSYSLLNELSEIDVAVFQSDKEISINKTKAFFTWRYINHPLNEYKILKLDDANAYVIYKSFINEDNQHFIDIMELQFDNNLENLKNILLAITDEQGGAVEAFNYWNSIFTASQILFERIGFRFVEPTTYLGFCNLAGNDNSIGDYSKWDINLSYSDVY